MEQVGIPERHRFVFARRKGGGGTGGTGGWRVEERVSEILLRSAYRRFGVGTLWIGSLTTNPLALALALALACCSAVLSPWCARGGACSDHGSPITERDVTDQLEDDV